MIIYENNISGFIEDCKKQNQDLLVTKIKSSMKIKMGRGVSPSEERSWRTTLTRVSKLFSNLKNKSNQYILLEFKVPTTYRRIDIILVGSNGKKNTLLIIELKGWSRSYKSKISYALDIDTNYGNGVSHPSDEAHDYKSILLNQFSDISNKYEDIKAVSLLPNYEIIKNDPLFAAEFTELLKYIKAYTKADYSEFMNFINDMFNTGIPHENVDFLNKLEYKPTINFKKHLENEFNKIDLSTDQKNAFNRIKYEIDNHLKSPTNKKLFIISGMPGSGKTIVAFKLLAYIYSRKDMTAKLQLPGPEFRNAVKKTYASNDFNNMIGGAYSKGDHQVVIIDEGHKAYGQGTSKQFYAELFRNQNFVIVLIDDKQVVNKKGFTKQQVIESSQKERFDVINIELREQFRNGGDALYIDWLRKWIFKEKDENNLQFEYVENSYVFKVLNEKSFNRKYNEMYKSNDIRMASFWTQAWNAEFDECLKPKKLITIGSSSYIWNPNEYWVKNFMKNNPNERISKNFMKKVVDVNFNKYKKGVEYIAYFNTIQGSEFEYIFVHIPKLFYLNDNNELDVDLSQLVMDDMKSQIWTKNHLPDKSKEDINKLYFKNRLLVNLTRGTKGTYIYCEDEKLAKWINNKIRK